MERGDGRESEAEMSSAVDTSKKDAWGVVAGAPARLLRLEGAALLAGSLLAYATTGQSWWLVPLAFLFPDLFAIGYLAGTKVGARTYNLAHVRRCRVRSS